MNLFFRKVQNRHADLEANDDCTGRKGTCGIIGVLHALDRLGVAIHKSARFRTGQEYAESHLLVAILTVSPSFWVLRPSPAIPM
jgi:hypothetical protein